MSGQTSEERAGEASPSLQSNLASADHRAPDDGNVVCAGAAPPVSDPVGLFKHLETSGRFHRDTGFGRLYHPDSVSFRENRPTDSLHVVIHDDRIAAHVDRVSPLDLRWERPFRYSLRRAVAHNVAGMAQDLARVLRGDQGDHRSELDCEWLWDRPVDVPETQGLPASASSLHLEARVSGVLDESRLQGALAQALGGRAATADVLHSVDCADDAALDAARAGLLEAPVPLTAWPPLRVRLARHPGGDVVMLNLNHAASDGFGALRVLGSIADAYAGRSHGLPPPDFLALCDLPVRPATPSPSRWMGGVRAAAERLRQLPMRSTRLAADGARDDPGYGFHLVCLTVEETDRILDIGRPGTSRNVLLAALHLTIASWNLDHGEPARRIGVLVQVNLRPPGWRNETIGNFSVTARVSTSRRHRARRLSALDTVATRTTRNRRARTGIALVAALERSGLLPLWAKQSRIVLHPLIRNRLVDAAMLANLGWLDEPPSFGTGAGETVDVWFSAPARAPQALCLGSVTVKGRLHLAFRYPLAVFGAGGARRFADRYVAQLGLLARDRR